MVDALLRIVDVHDEPVTLVVHQLRQFASAAADVQNDSPASRNVLGDHISDSLVVLDPVEIPLVPCLVKIIERQTHSL